MNDLFLKNLIIEKKDITNISYILEDNSLFFQTGYKVLQNQENNGFIKAVKVIHNGKVRLLYDISKYKSLLSIISMINGQEFLTILSKLLEIICEASKNGFMQIENININFEDIYVDINNFNIYLIYIPVVCNDDNNSNLEFEDKFKTTLIKIISSNRNINNELVSRMYSHLNTKSITLEDLREYVSTLNYSSKTYEKNRYINNNGSNEERANVNKPVTNNNVSENKIEEKKSGVFKSIMNKFFKEGSEHSSKEEVKVKNNDDERAIDNLGSYKDGETSLLSGDIFIPSIAIVREDTMETVNIPITKKDFIIGKSTEMADGVISFNKAISRIHCRIIYIDGRYFIRDEKSVNGTFVNNKRVPVEGEVLIKSGDIIKLANSEFLVKSI